MIKVLYVDTISTSGAIANCRGMERAFRKVAEVKPFDYRKHAACLGVHEMNELLVDAALGFCPDLVYMGKSELITGDSVRIIKWNLPGCFVAHFYGDVRRKVQPWVADIGKYADITLLQHEDQPTFDAHFRAGCKRVGTMLAGTDPDVFYRRVGQKHYDFVFMANHSRVEKELGADRIGFVKSLRSAGLKVDVFGHGWPAEIEAHPYVASEKFADACSHAQIALNYCADFFYLWTSWPRVLNSMASGCFMLTRYFPGLETLFEKRRDLVWFSSHYEAITLAKYYLEHADERKKIAEAGRKKVLKNHTWDHRIGMILDIAGLSK